MKAKTVMLKMTAVEPIMKLDILLDCSPSPVLGSPGVVTVAVDALTTVAAGQFGAVIVSAAVETVPPNESARPVQLTLLPTVLPEAAMTVPKNVESAPSVVACVGVHQTSQIDAPFATDTTELAEVLSAPSTRNMYVPAPLRVIVPPPPTESPHGRQTNKAFRRG
jgi:hypothetical protein